MSAPVEDFVGAAIFGAHITIRLMEDDDDTIYGRIRGFLRNLWNGLPISCDGSTATTEDESQFRCTKEEDRTNSHQPSAMQESSDSSVESHACAVCWSEKPDVLFKPCYHLVVCKRCFESLERAHGVKQCPLCREAIRQATVYQYGP